MCSVMRGAGESVVPMLTVVTSQVLLRIPGVYLLAHFFGPDYMYYAFGTGWSFGAVIALAYFASGRWKRHRSMAEEDAAAAPVPGEQAAEGSQPPEQP